MSDNPHPSKITAVIWRTQEAPDVPKDFLIIYKLGDYDIQVIKKTYLVSKS